jgi:predicted secreted protein
MAGRRAGAGVKNTMRIKMRFITVLCFAMLSTASDAADGAKFRALGFLPDAKYFAFEQYGVQDGSGFAYDDVYVIDIAKDTWVKGTPIKTLLEDEIGSVAAVRLKAKKDSQVFLQQAGSSEDAEFLAANPFGELVGDRTRVTFHDHYNNSMGFIGNAEDQGSWMLSVKPKKIPLPPDCEGDSEALGFRLEIKNNKSGLVTVLHEDFELPKSRGCALFYDVEAIVQPAGGAENGQLVAIVGVSRRGFEGADRRFIAVPFKFN